MCSQHLGIGKSGANTRGVDSGTRQVLTGSTHHPYHRVLAGDMAKRIRHRYKERGADMQIALPALMSGTSAWLSRWGAMALMFNTSASASLSTDCRYR